MSQRDTQMDIRHEPVLIGAPGSGKSTLAWRLSQQLGIPVISVDAIAPQLFPHLGMDVTYAEALYTRRQIHDWLHYVRPFEHLALEVILRSHGNCVLDVGAGHVLPSPEPTAEHDPHTGLPRTLLAELRSFKWIVHVQPAGSSSPAGVALCQRRLLRRLRRLNEPHPMEVASSVAEYFGLRQLEYHALATVSVETGKGGSRTIARSLVCRLGLHGAR